jgi:SulP family sulfate permease
LQIGGPTGAFVVIVAGIVARHGVEGLFVCTLMAGVMLVVLGATGMGSAVRFIPRPVVVGFTNGIAVLIASTQIRDFFGLRIDTLPGDFLPRMQLLSLAVPDLVAPRHEPRPRRDRRHRRREPRLDTHPGSDCRPLPRHVDRRSFSGCPSRRSAHGLAAFRPACHRFTCPGFHFALLGTLVVPAMTVAMLGAIESLMSAMVADRMSGDRHDSNVELVAQGMANIASPLFGGCRPRERSPAPPRTSARERRRPSPASCMRCTWR